MTTIIWDQEPEPLLLRPIDELSDDFEFCKTPYLAILKNADIYYIGDLIIRTEQELLALPGFTEDCLNGLKELLTARGLSLETRLEHWPPPGWRRDK
jgi:DNA-directed RNA polymerase subunit alpha